MVFLNELLEILFYLGLTVIVELVVLLGLGYFNKKFITILLLLNLVTSTVYGTLLASYSHLFDSEMGMVLVLLLEVIIIAVEFFVLFKYLNSKYSRLEILITVILVNGFSFLLTEFVRYLFEYLEVFPIL